MITRRGVFGVVAGAGVVAAFAGLQLGGSTQPAAAGERRVFSAQAFQAAQSAGRPILVDIAASWCPTCRRQKPIINDLAGKPKFKNLIVFEVDYDSQRDVVRALGAQRQSTLIAYRGATEVGRSVADTRAASIEAMLDRTI